IPSVVAGQLLLTELSCTACHSSSQFQLEAKRGPDLSAAGSRMQQRWVEQFLLSPQQHKPGTTMPQMLTGIADSDRPKVARELAAFLNSLQKPFPEIKATGANPVPLEFWNRGNVDRGRDLYHQIGCVACHDADPGYEVAAVKPSPTEQLLDQLTAEELEDLGLTSAARRVASIPHPRLSEKYHSQSQTFFLLNPEQVRPAGRMPGFGLSAVDAADLAAYLLNRDAAAEGHDTSSAKTSADDSTTSTAADTDMVAAGRQWFTQLRCAACHEVQGIPKPPMARPLAALNKVAGIQCLKTGSQGQFGFLPHFTLDDAQQTAVLSAVGTASTPATTAQDQLNFQLLQSNCYACHEREKLGGVGRYRRSYFETVGNVDIGDEGRLPPTLTGAGSKLTTAWLGNVFSGKGRLRPHMTIRMPQFPSSVTKALPSQFDLVDRQSNRNTSAKAVFAGSATAEQIAAGRILMDTGCVQCHGFKGQFLPGTVGVDLAGATERLRPEWLHQFLRDPGSLKAGTRMPTFFPNGRSQNKDVLGGDVEQQIQAMYAYLKDLNKQPIPERILQARAQNYVLSPSDRPLILRTFMRDAGLHAIAVGFPQNVHLAFDSENLFPAEVWRGSFIDAEGTWFVRFAPLADPLGDHRVMLPAGMVVSRLSQSSAPWPASAEAAGAAFGGYRIDKSGVPTFLYRLPKIQVEDRMQPTDNGGLKRMLTLRSLSPAADSRNGSSGTLWLRLLTGTSLQSLDAQSMRNDKNLTVQFSAPDDVLKRNADGSASLVRSAGSGREWLVPLNESAIESAQTTIEVQYQW
ncbi:MAG: c-type cytochrome, partial [Planctomycetaceae bacterium]|nr:c-type cytochrome [Planctomycetaceae bacterium]